MFLMPGLVITCHVSGVLDQVLSRHAKQEMVRYLSNMQNTDGGYGLHIEGHSTMFGTVLRYGPLVCVWGWGMHNRGSCALCSSQSMLPVSMLPAYIALSVQPFGTESMLYI